MDLIFIFAGFFTFGYICGVGAIGDFMKDDAYKVIQENSDAHKEFARKIVLLSVIVTILTNYLT